MPLSATSYVHSSPAGVAPLIPGFGQSHGASAGSITEIVLPDGDEQGLSLVLPMLAHQSQQEPDRWLTWVAPQGITVKQLTPFGFASERLRLVHTRDQAENMWVFWQALCQGNSGLVVAQLHELSEDDRITLEHASRSGQTRGIVLRVR